MMDGAIEAGGPNLRQVPLHHEAEIDGSRPLQARAIWALLGRSTSEFLELRCGGTDWANIHVLGSPPVFDAPRSDLLKHWQSLEVLASQIVRAQGSIRGQSRQLLGLHTLQGGDAKCYSWRCGLNHH